MTDSEGFYKSRAENDIPKQAEYIKNNVDLSSGGYLR
jgi:hypothetical protein